MSIKDKLFARLTSDHARLAELALAEGRKAEAADLFAKAGDFDRAVRLAAELRDVPRAVEFSLRAVLGSVPEGFDGGDARQAGELLAKSGRPKEAIPLYELAGAWREAAEVSLRLQQPQRAARYYEKARAFSESALYYERANQPNDAVRVLELEAKRLEQEAKGRNDPRLAEARRKIDMQRASLLAKLGKTSEAAAAVSASTPTPKTAQMLEAAGRFREALEMFLAMGEVQQALRLMPKSPDLDRRVAAQIFARAGRHGDAGNIYAALGMSREAAEAFEQAAEWERAGQRWEEAREPLRAASAYLRGAKLREAGMAYMNAGQPLAAAEAFVRAGETALAGQAYLRAGKAVESAAQFLHGKNRGEALRVLRLVTHGQPEFERATLQLVGLLLEDAQLDEAWHRLRTLPADERLPPDLLADKAYWEARVLEAQAKVFEASERYQTAMRARPGHRDSEERLRRLRNLTATRSDVAPAPPTVVQPVLAADRGPEVFAGRYELLGRIGRGGMGQVFKARDRELDEIVAIKTLLSGASGTATEERLLRELQICRKITHPNVVRVFDLGRFEQGIFFTMEFLEGRSLEELLHAKEPFTLERTRSILLEIAAGLAEAHTLGIVHRDLKPGNVLLAGARVKILDFGIARMDGGDTRLTRTGHAVGSPMYMSPEQLQGESVDARSDLYALGVLAFTLLAGREPFAGDTLTALALAHLQSPPPDLRRFRPELPLVWKTFVETLLAKRPEQRYPSARAASDALAALPLA